MANCMGLPVGSSMEFSFELHDRVEQLRSMAQIAASNLQNRGKADHNKHTFAVVPGASGIGKSRFGFEVATLMETLLHGEAAGTFGGAGGGAGVGSPKIVTRYVFVDFNNGQRFYEAFDSRRDEDLRMGVRLAAQGLVQRHFLGLVRKSPSEYAAFTVNAVLQRIVADALRAATDKTIVALVLHLDEFQAYVDAFDNQAAGRAALKGMLRCVGDFMRTGLTGTALHRRFFVVPVLTGTAATDVNFLLTDKYKEEILLLEPLSEDSALAMFDETFPDHEVVRRRDHFRIALADTGYVPRIVQFLLSLPRGVDVATANWGGRLAGLYNVHDTLRRSLKLQHFGGAEPAEAVIHFALSAQPVEREFVLPGGITVAELERKGELLLVPMHGSSAFHLRLPFVRLAAINHLLLLETGSSAFPTELLFFPTVTRPWRWQEFEELHANFQALRMKALVAAQQARIAAAIIQLEVAVDAANSEVVDAERECAIAKRNSRQTRLTQLRNDVAAGFCLADVCRGAVGHPVTLARRVLLRDAVPCFHEKYQWIVRRTDEPSVADAVDCNERDDVGLQGGVFLCAPGTAHFDGRFYCASPASDKPVLVAWQDKHSELTSDSTVSAQFILDWHRGARKSLVHWLDTHDVVLLFLTNRRLTGQLGDLAQGLLVVTREQLGQYLSPTFAGRGLIPHDDV